MGLFDKKYCDICKEKIGLLGNRKLEDGNLCKDCAKKLSPWFSDRRSSTVEQIKEQLAYREANRSKAAQFRATKSFGEGMRVLIDEPHIQFMVTRADDLASANPDVIDFASIVDCTMDVDEHCTEVMRTDRDGKRVSYNPPRYEYRYDFDITIRVNTPYFDEIKFQLNENDVRIISEAPGTVGLFGRGASIDPSYNIEYRKYMDMGTALCREMCEIRDRMADIGRMQQTYNATGELPNADAELEALRRKAGITDSAAAAPASGPWTCPACGAQNAGGKFCEFCGTKR